MYTTVVITFKYFEFQTDGNESITIKAIVYHFLYLLALLHFCITQL